MSKIVIVEIEPKIRSYLFDIFKNLNNLLTFLRIFYKYIFCLL